MSRSRRLVAGLIAAGALLALAVSGAAAQSPTPAPYKRIGQWPAPSAVPSGVFRDVVALDVALDGRVYVADRGAGGIHTMLPSGTFLPPFGATESGAARLGGVGRIAVDQTAGRVYVVDTGIQRIAVYDLDGRFLTSWPGIDAAAVAVGPDGRVYVADRESNAVQAFDAGGARLFAFGSLGTQDGSFTLLADLSVSADGRTIAVGDLNRLRLQLFDLSAGGATHRRTYMLNHPRFAPKTGGPPYNQCRAGVVFALGGDQVWVGDGTGACRISPDGFAYTIAASANAGSICKQTVRAPRIRLDTGQYYAVADYDPNAGPCYSARRAKDTRLPTTPAVVQYLDLDMRAPAAVHLTGRDARDDPGLVAPWFASAPAADRVFVMDATRYARLFGPDGTAVGSIALTSSQTGGVTRRFRVERADGTGVDGELFGYYREERRARRAGDDLGEPTPTPVPGVPTPAIPEPDAGSTWVEDGHGIGRFRSVKADEYGNEVQVLEPIWTVHFGTPSLERSRDLGSASRTFLQVVDMAYRAPGREVVALVYERQPARKTDDAKLVLVSADGSGEAAEWDLPDDAVTAFAVNPYVDLSVGPDGRIYVLDDYRDVAVAFEPDGTRLPDIPVTADVRAVAGGPGGVLFGLRESGYVERTAPDGTVTARFDGRPFGTADPLTLSALAADEAGRVYVADALSSVVSVFAPAPEGDPALPVPGDATCLFAGSKAAAPAELVLGDRTEVTLGIDGLCGVGEEPTDIVVVALYYPDLRTPDPAERTIKLLRRLVARIDFAKHRVGLVGYFRDSSIEAPLTHDRDRVLEAIQRMPRKWPPVCYAYEFGDTSYAFCRQVAPVLREGLKTGQAAFEAQSDRRRVMVVFHPDYCNRDFEYYDGACRIYPAAEDTAREIRDAGTQVVVYDGDRSGWRRYHLADGGAWGGRTLYNADAQPLASSDADVALTFADAQHRMVRYRVPEELATDFRLTDTLPANMPLVPGSPSAGAVVSGADVRWRVTALPYGPTTFSLSVTPADVGRWPTNVRAVADFTDGWGQAGRIVFPIPEVVVRAPTPSPTATPSPSATVTPLPPATATPPRPRPLYLPVALSRHCTPGTMRIDVALVVDTSSSMAGAKLDAAREAIATFLDLLALRPGGDAAALVSFHEAAAVLQPLTSDRVSLQDALAGLATRPGTRIDLGLAAGLDALAAAEQAPNRHPVVVLLSDGRQDDAAPAAAQGDRARAAGIEVFTIGLGADVDVDLLRAVATDVDHAYVAPTPDDLRAIYTAVARAIPCR